MNRNKTAECPACSTLLEMRGESLAVAQSNIAKCEECGAEETFAGWPEDWTQTGRSKKYGKAYQSSGIAWHCPTHQGIARYGPKSALAHTTIQRSRGTTTVS